MQCFMPALVYRLVYTVYITKMCVWRTVETGGKLSNNATWGIAPQEIHSTRYWGY